MKVYPTSNSATSKYLKSRNSPQSFKLIASVVIATMILTYVVTIRYLPSQPTAQLKSWATDRGHNFFNNDKRLLESIADLPKALVNNTEVPKLIIDINFKHMLKLQEKRNEAIQKGVLVRGDDDFVPATIRYDDRNVKVKLRLKGDWTDHLKGNKWSFRIRTKKKDHVFNMRRFSIQHPKTRGYQGEPLFFNTLRKLGVLSPRYFFVDVVINGDPIGIMALEEHMSKELLEFNKRRESVIVRLNESLLWDARASEGIGFDDRVYHNYMNAMIDPFQSSRIKQSEKLSIDNNVAIGLLRGFINNRLKASDVFDPILMGKFLAAAELWGARHAIYWHNMRFYLNPISLKLEPIGFDSNVHESADTEELIWKSEPIVKAMLDDPKIFNVYINTTQELAKEITSGKLLDDLVTEENHHLDILRKEFYFIEGYPFEALKKRASYILSLSASDFENRRVHINEDNYPKLLHAYILRDKDGQYLELSNAVPHDVAIKNIRWVGKKSKDIIKFTPTPESTIPASIEKTPTSTLPIKQKIYFNGPTKQDNFKLEVIASLDNQKVEKTTIAEYYSGIFDSNPLPISSTPEQLAKNQFITFDDANHLITFKKGKWRIEESLVIPKGYKLILEKGVNLTFGEGIYFVSYSPVYFNGTKDDPISMKGTLTHKDQKTWQGLAVLNAITPSKLENVEISNTSGINEEHWRLTGGVTFYQSDVELLDCMIHDNKAEDALNIIHSKFKIKNIHINNTVSDAFDADFTEGTIENGLFRDIGLAGGGDAVDISGSNVKINGTTFEDVNDKALSVGEKSNMIAKGVKIIRSGTGAASKDGSTLDISDSSIELTSNAGLMAYIKKPEYGFAQITANHLVIRNNPSTARVQKGSSITIDGKSVLTEDVDVKELYKTIMKPGLRK